MHRTALAVLCVAPIASLAHAQIGSTDDLWDHSRGSRVIDHSPFDIDGGSDGGYDARDAFGGEFNDFPQAFGAIIFDDHKPKGAAHWIEWRAAAPIDLERFTMSASADIHADDLRATSEFRLYARDEAGAPWMLLHEAVRTDEAVFRHPHWTLDHEFKTPRRNLLEFRAEFVQASGRTDYGGPRVWELDGFGEYSIAAAPAIAHQRKGVRAMRTLSRGKLTLAP